MPEVSKKGLREKMALFALDNNLDHAEIVELQRYIVGGDFAKYGRYSHKPKSVRYFIEDPEFLNAKNILYPNVMDEVAELNSGEYVEAVLTGSIGSGKTTIALYTTAYQLYLLSCMVNPHKVYDLDPTSEIEFIFQNVNSALAKSVSYQRFRHLILNSPYFKKHFPFDTSIESELRFPNRIVVKPVSGESTAAIGQNVIGGILDEVNFMAIVEKSKASDDGTGVYDQAISNYNAIARRRKSRFLKQGKVAGILCIVSSKRYPGQFTDVKQEEAKEDNTIFVYDKRTWDIKPEGSYILGWFRVFVGDLTRSARVLEPEDIVDPKDAHLVMDIPEEYRAEFRASIINSLRDIAGVSTLATHPYIKDAEVVASAFGTADSILSGNSCNFKTSTVSVHRSRFKNLSRPRFVHIDLGVTGDAAGVSCGYVSGFTEVANTNGAELLPVVEFDFTLRVTPPVGDEILFFKIRKLLYTCIDMGLPIKWASLDSFQSRDTLQLLRQQGVSTGLVSVDSTMVPYDTLKTAFYQRRLRLPADDYCLRELKSLEYDMKKGKVDHTVQSTKDVADSLAGVVYGLTMQRETWTAFGVNTYQIPESIQQIVLSQSGVFKEALPGLDGTQ